MKISDIFDLDRRIAFVGEIAGDDKLIRPCDCELLIPGHTPIDLRIDGEDLLCPIPPSGRALRAVSTSWRGDLALIRSAPGRCELRSVN